MTKITISLLLVIFYSHILLISLYILNIGNHIQNPLIRHLVLRT